MEQPLNKIRVLVKELPEKDSRLAEKFVEERQFDKLLDLVNSDIYLVRQNSRSDNSKPKFADINLKKLMELKECIEEYISFIYLPEDDDSWIYE